MPELLEVKTIKRVIAPQIQELTIERVQIRRQVVVAPPPPRRHSAGNWPDRRYPVWSAGKNSCVSG